MTPGLHPQFAKVPLAVYVIFGALILALASGIHQISTKARQSNSKTVKIIAYITIFLIVIMGGGAIFIFIAAIWHYALYQTPLEM